MTGRYGLVTTALALGAGLGIGQVFAGVGRGAAAPEAATEVAVHTAPSLPDSGARAPCRPGEAPPARVHVISHGLFFHPGPVPCPAADTATQARLPGREMGRR
jgi:hypothetical protein